MEKEEDSYLKFDSSRILLAGQISDGSYVDLSLCYGKRIKVFAKLKIVNTDEKYLLIDLEQILEVDSEGFISGECFKRTP
ncbi:hypothetical protein C2869_10515 [Saccharobesus litoralis]|uniref:Uncharacterized protein n=1 Tax=Saccharobesus litoralis TaxID=2172099 RepID=A0A2S0VRJ2_9ALTE|nr:hypothetical protein [Saccharobesus litoralis]AWB66837.1 hypothetical protein C2869_10515 [Saccharobesus litoralis]